MQSRSGGEGTWGHLEWRRALQWDSDGLSAGKEIFQCLRPQCSGAIYEHATRYCLEMEMVWGESIPRGREGGISVHSVLGWHRQRALGQLRGETTVSLSKAEASKHTKTQQEWLKNPAGWRKQWLQQQQKKVGGKKRKGA